MRPSQALRPASGAMERSLQTVKSYAEKAAHFADLHAREKTFVIPNPWDAGTARLLEHLGYEALTTTSAGLAFALGRPDGARAVSRDEALENAKAINDATSLPVAADLENGYGDAPETAAETIRLAGTYAGLAGGSIEDATGDPASPIYEAAFAAQRIAAAAQAARRLPHPFVLVARAENYLHGIHDLADTIARLQAFEAAGADVLYAPGLSTIDEVRAVCAAVRKPVNVLAGFGAVPLTVAQLAALGVRRISVGSALNRAALGAFYRAAREIRETGTFGFAADAAPYPNLNELMGAGG